MWMRTRRGRIPIRKKIFIFSFLLFFNIFVHFIFFYFIFLPLNVWSTNGIAPRELFRYFLLVVVGSAKFPIQYSKKKSLKRKFWTQCWIEMCLFLIILRHFLSFSLFFFLTKIQKLSFFSHNDFLWNEKYQKNIQLRLVVLS
jgi:glucan phosphoethanolaminetransferase (alkaline phosphatase superfamily)